MTPQEKLAACPFCGNGNTLMVEHVEGTVLHPAYYVRCDNCGAIGPTTDNGGHADLWNSRPATLLSEHGGGGEVAELKLVQGFNAYGGKSTTVIFPEGMDLPKGEYPIYLMRPPTPSASCPATPMDLIAADPTVAYKRGWDDAMKQATPNAPFRGLDSQGKPIYGNPPAVTTTTTDCTTPSAPVVDYTDIANRAQEATGRSIWPSTVKAVLEAAALSGVSAPVGVEERVRGIIALLRKAEPDNGEKYTEHDAGYDQASREIADMLERALTPPAAAPRVEEQRCSEPCGDAMTTGDCPCTATREDGLHPDWQACTTLEELADGLAGNALAGYQAAMRKDAMDCLIRAKQLAASGQGVEWRPIETAPKDGTEILACNDEVTLVTRWFGGGLTWYYRSDDYSVDDWSPTHWMPLPAAPTQEGK